MLVEQLQARFESNYHKLKDYGWKCNSNGDIDARYFGIFIDQGNVSWGVGIEFDTADLRNGYYGVYCHKDENRELYDLIWNLFDKSGLRAHFKYTRFWAMWEWMDSNIRNWDAAILRKIPSGELANQIFDLWRPLLDVISKNIEDISSLEK